ncbi:CHAT domain-containing protein [Mycena maculata]|uniref:CHAT domain-containing protein n=1 Tax=Mycena maculata TaxID=230809 RepID=A0AAD7I3B0_9AGAR|nr:CHAT domain-containing protein [Mycena maculata]
MCPPADNVAKQLDNLSKNTVGPLGDEPKTGDTLQEIGPGDNTLTKKSITDSELKEKTQTGWTSYQRYWNAGDLNDLEAAVQKFQEVVELTPKSNPHGPLWLTNLAVALRNRYQRLGDPRDLEAALQGHQEAVKLAPADNLGRVVWLQELAVSLRIRYQKSGDLKDLESTLQGHQDIVDSTPADHPDRAERLQNLAISLTDRFERLGDIKDLEAALHRNQAVVDLTPADHPHRGSRLQNYAASLTHRYHRLGELKDLEAALRGNQETIGIGGWEVSRIWRPHCRDTKMQWTLPHPITLTGQNGYTILLLGELKDLEAALQGHQEAVDLTPEDHPNRARQLQMLAASFIDRYDRFRKLKDLEVALQGHQEAVKLTPVDHPDRASRLQHLAVSFTNRHWRLGDLQDLEAAVKRFQEVVELTPPDHPDRAERLHYLAASFRARYQRLGKMKDLEAALRGHQEAVRLTPEDHPDWVGRMHNLAISWTDQYQRLGELKDLEAAVQGHQEVVRLTPADNPARAGSLYNLGISLAHRYRRLGDFKDLEGAIRRFHEAVELTPEDHPNKGRWLKTLASSFTDRYERLGDLRDLDAALQGNHKALALLPEDHPNRADQLKLLALSFTYRFHRLGELKDLEAALQLSQEAVDSTPENHPHRMGCLQHLAISFLDRYRRLGDPKDLEAAMQGHQEVEGLTLADDPSKARQLQNLAVCLANRYQKFQDPEDLKLVHSHYSKSFRTQAHDDPESMWRAALYWVSFSKRYQPVYCPTAYSAAFSILPEILWIGNIIPVRQDAIRRLNVGNTTAAAMRTCITLNDLVSAVQLIEQGLATTFQRLLQLKPDFDVLPLDQGDQLRKLSHELYSGTNNNLSRIAYQRGELLREIRKQPDLEHFLLPQPYQVLRCVSQEGPVVILNSDEDGCDGVIILDTAPDPVHVALPNVSMDSLKFQKNALKELLNHCNVRTRGESVSTRLFGHREGFRSRTIEEHFTDLLSWLWNNVVEHVYHILASYGIHNGRLWWLPSGSFTGLPLHACPPTDQFIHSYTATLGLLLEARAKGSLNNQCKVGVVGVTHTGLHGANYLKGVKQEVEKICSIIKDNHLQCLEGEQATPAAVQNQLQNCSWVHLACHGTQDLIEPIKSRLLLYDGVLEIETILQMPLSNAEFVFLAACQTAMGDTTLANESFHLGGAFIAEGFRGAVGTLWSMNDQDGPIVAETIYSHLFRDGRQRQTSDTAEALQVAVNKLKADKVPYQRWIPFIHMGI